MSTSDVAHISGSIVKWARERAGPSHEKVATQLNNVKASHESEWRGVLLLLLLVVAIPPLSQQGITDDIEEFQGRLPLFVNNSAEIGNRKADLRRFFHEEDRE